MYNFMVDVGNKSAPTFLRSFLVSLTFCNFILGLTGSDDAIASQRVQGCARESYLRKRKLQQRPPLSVAQVKSLELYVSNMMGTPRDVYAAGCFLLCIYMRARFSDMQHMTDIVVDEVVNEGNVAGYIESKVTRSKSAYTTERKTMFLPMAAPLIGVSGKDWVRQWQQARMLSSVPRGEELPLLPNLLATDGLEFPWLLPWVATGSGKYLLHWALIRIKSKTLVRIAARQLVSVGCRKQGLILPAADSWDTMWTHQRRLVWFIAEMLHQAHSGSSTRSLGGSVDS